MATPELNAFVRAALAEYADPTLIPGMQAYLKTHTPFLGVMADGRKEVIRAAAARFPVTDRRANDRQIAELWREPEREMKYVAVGLARRRRKLVGSASLDLYERMVREGAWWDFVDEIAIHLVGVAGAAEPEVIRTSMDSWIEDPDMWIRRTAIIFQNRHREKADEARLFQYCRARMHEKEFFIRKAIGWALRERAKTAPDAVRAFVAANREQMSGLSVREAMKHF